MAARRKVGLIYSYDEHWIGGTYYIHHLIQALKTLEDSEQPELYLICRDRELFENLQKEIQYPYAFFLPPYVAPKIPRRILNKVRTLLGLEAKDWKKGKVEVVFPVIGNYDYGYGDKRIHWIPDFQVNNLPFFFSEEERRSRESSQQETSKSRGEALVVSSEHALADYLKFYPDAVTKNYVLPFAVTHGSIDGLSLESLKEKFNLHTDYFISPNQFWAHKNHRVILEAVNAMVKRDKKVKVVFTGKEHDHRSPGYFDELKQYVKEEGLENYVSFLGFIDRAEQLKLIENAVAVIQPSRFEGWSSVVEDGKALSKRIIASDIPVHREQLRDLGVYFDLTDADGLSRKMEQFLHTGSETIDYGYGNEKKVFGKKFMSIVESVANNRKQAIHEQ